MVKYIFYIQVCFLLFFFFSKGRLHLKGLLHGGGGRGTVAIGSMQVCEELSKKCFLLQRGVTWRENFLP